MQHSLQTLALAGAALLAFSAEAQAQATREFSFTYAGKVETSPSQTATTVSGQPFSSTHIALPRYTFETGDAFSVLFSGVVPFLDGFAPGADGLVRSKILGSGQTSGPPESARIKSVAIEGLSGDRQVPGLFGIRDAEVIYDPATREYRLQVNNNTNSVGTFNLPDYVLQEDPSTGVRTAQIRTTPPVNTQLGWSNGTIKDGVLTLQGPDISFGSSTTLNGSAGPISIRGAFGGFSVGTGAPDPVPEPATLILFGGGAALLLHGRRKRKAEPASAV